MGFHMRSARRRGLLTLTLAVLLAGLLWGVGGALASSSPSPSSSTEVTLRLGWITDPDNINPFIGYMSSSYEIWHLNYDMLFGFNAKDMTPKPELAADFGTWSADGKTYTVKLRPGVMFQDGVPLTAADVEWTYNFIIDNDMTAFSSYTKGILHVKAVDPQTVEFQCDGYKANITQLWIPILPKHIWAGKINPQYPQRFKMTLPLVGSGPFQLTELKQGKYAIMKANPGYWRVKPKIDRVIFVVYQNPDTMASDLQSGLLQAAYSIPVAKFHEMQQNPGDLKMIDYQTKSMDYLAFNCYDSKYSKGNPVLRDVNFRQALQWAIDRQRICEFAYQGYAIPGSSPITQGVYKNPDWHWQPPADVAYGYDLNKAKQLLDAAGYKDVNGDGWRENKQGKKLQLRLWSRSESLTSQNIGKIVAGAFKSIGLDINYQIMSEGAVSDAAYNYTGNNMAPDYDMIFWDTVGYSDPGDTLASWVTDQRGNWNEAYWSNLQYDALYTQQAKEPDQAKRLTMIQDMQKIFYHDSPYIIIDYAKDLEGYNDTSWTGWVRAPEGQGGVFYVNDNIDSYLFVHPTAGTTASKGGVSAATWIIIGVVVVLVVGGLLLWLMRRGRAREVEV